MDWEIEVGFLPEAISCKGSTKYIALGDETEVHILGDLDIDGTKLPNLPRLIAPKIERALENLVLKLISPNLVDANRGLESYLRDL